jgi:pimeloyl-ACP methyl ester carboxylesterase
MDAFGLERATLVGNSMGAQTAAAFALRAPGRVAALALITPAYPGHPPSPHDLDEWDRLAVGLRSGGVDGFLDAYRPDVEERQREVVMAFTRRRLERHRDLEAVADALAVVPRSRAFDGLEALETIEAPALVVGSRDGTDPGHPLEVAEAWAEHLGAELEVEREGEQPLAWRGAELSATIAAFLERRGGE